MADPGFPVGGANSRGGYVLKNLYVKTKESGPLGARTGGACNICLAVHNTLIFEI